MIRPIRICRCFFFSSWICMGWMRIAYQILVTRGPWSLMVRPFAPPTSSHKFSNFAQYADIEIYFVYIYIFFKLHIHIDNMILLHYVSASSSSSCSSKWGSNTSFWTTSSMLRREITPQIRHGELRCSEFTDYYFTLFLVNITDTVLAWFLDPIYIYIRLHHQAEIRIGSMDSVIPTMSWQKWLESDSRLGLFRGSSVQELLRYCLLRSHDSPTDTLLNHLLG